MRANATNKESQARRLLKGVRMQSELLGEFAHAHNGASVSWREHARDRHQHTVKHYVTALTYFSYAKLALKKFHF